MSDYARHLVYETEGRRGADERGWNGEAARIAEIERQREEEYAYRAAEAANEEPDPRDCERHEPTCRNCGRGLAHDEPCPPMEDEYREPGEPPPVPPTCGRCFAFTCPLGYDLTPSQYAQDAKEFRKRGMNPEEFSDGEWMLVRVTTDGRLVGAKERTNV
jgi:hypothetical protein